MNTQNKLKLLVHSEYLKTVNAFHHYAVKNGLELKMAFSPEKLLTRRGEAVIVIGVDQDWLRSVIGNLKEYGAYIIIIAGEPQDDIDNVSYVNIDQRSLMRSSLEYLASRGRSRTAFFGVQKNDLSDNIKKITFLKYHGEDSVYMLDGTVSAAFDRFFADAGRYDSVICSNDITAYCFLRRCREVGIRVPCDLYLVGNGDLWMSSHMKPSLTTATYDWQGKVKNVVSIIQHIFGLPSFNSLEMNLDAVLVTRESTGHSFVSSSGDEPKQTLPTALSDHKIILPGIDPEIQMLHNLNQTLFCASPVQKEILGRLTKHESYEEIADALVMSTDAVKYHSKKLYRQLEVHSKTELSRLFGMYGIIL